MAWLCMDLLTDSPRVTLVVFSKMLWVMGARGGDSAATAYCKPRMCPAPTPTYGFEAACPSGTGVIPSLRGLGWERVPLSRAGQRKMQLTCSCWDDGQQTSHCQQQQGLGLLFQIR